MIKVLIDLLTFLRTTVPLLFCVAVFALLFIWLAKSIKKYYYIYYTLFAIPFLMVVVPSLLRIFGVETSFNFTRIPVLGEILRDYIHMASLGHPLLIIIMYMGALDVKNTYVKRLMSIRKEISILSGFPILTHSWIRVMNNFPEALKYFTDHAEFMENPRVTSALGAGITNTVLVLGIVMLVLFFILWITSFDTVHKRLGGIRWKKIQRWSYALYALLFIHAMGLQVGRMVSSAATTKPQTEVVAKAQETRPAQGGGGERTQATPQAQGGHGGRTPSKGLADIKVNNTAKQWISVSSLLLIYGSYLILRVRKAGKKGKKKGISITA
ncbi:DMSO/TMAO reductase YedYZ heme-binding membrane subunit [Parabacteroides sp. PFB2-10]|uniref:ferric reductase-like transmembrane domain-containing protein n=1 Tax=Parabacteroides sp. PFB2-10 TaxID=1742405 RepID=UPI0024764438|nr:ferric reductase-like transmembrane domain-containing protein [Parabacteroides sp. PFB2-10]MDH6313791.1 DMSO/TMAO reductase YedYZ heme-binding membrane subunit [Parabacteroides sp. PFB2-10]